MPVATVQLFLKPRFLCVIVTAMYVDVYLIVSQVLPFIRFSRSNISQNSESLVLPFTFSSSVSIFTSPKSTMFSYVLVVLSRQMFNSEKKVSKFVLGTVYYLLGVRDRCSVGKTQGNCSCPLNKNFQKSWCPVSGKKEKVHVPYNYTILTLRWRHNMQ